MHRLWITKRSDLVKFTLMIIVGIALLVVGVCSGPDWLRTGAGVLLLAAGAGNLTRLYQVPPEEP